MADSIRVLFVDDEKDFLDLGKQFLEESGNFSVTTSNSASFALKILDKQHFDAIVSDYQMPGMDGIQFLIEVRARFGLIPFILFTGKSREEGVIQAINNGTDFYLQKGGEPDEQFSELSHKIRVGVDRRNSDIALKESEKKYRCIVETANEGIWVMDHLLVTTYVNEQMAEMLGYTTDAILGKKFQFFIPAEELADNQLEFQKSMEGQSGSYERRFRVKDGEVKTFHVSAKPLIGEDSSFQGSFAMLTDVTKHKQTESALESQSTMLSILNDIISMANKADDLPQLLNTILQESLRLLDFDAGGIYLVDRSTRTANVIHSKNLPLEFLAEIEKISIDEKPYDALFIQNKPIFTENYAQIAPGLSKKFGFQSIASIPLLSKGVAMGALNIASLRRYMLSEVEKQTFISIGRELGSSIERMAAEEEVKKAAKNLETLFNSIDEMVFVLDMQGHILAVNNAVLQRLLYSSEELTGTDVLMLHVPERRAEALRNVKGMIAGTIDSCPVPVLAKDGKRIEVETKVTHGWWNNEEVLIGVSRDITQRKQAEENLLQLSDRLSLATRVGGVGVWDYDVVNNTLTWDDQMFALYGITTEQFSGAYEAWQAGVHPDDQIRGDIEIQMALRGEKEFDTEFRVLWPEGSIRNIRALALVQRDEFGKPLRMIGTNWDITPQKLAVEALRLANNKLNLLSSITRHDILNKVMVSSFYSTEIRNEVTDPAHIKKLDAIHQVSGEIQTLIEFTGQYQDLGAIEPAWQNVDSILHKHLIQGLLYDIKFESNLGKLEIFADRMLEKVLYNLVENSVRHGQNLTGIRFFSHEKEGDLILCYEDDGGGILDAEKEKIFRRGFGKNTGLGLFLTREILSITGITICENGEPGKGARFEITVPNGKWRTGETGREKN